MPEIRTLSFALTVAEGKRLIARGVAALPAVQQAMKQGMVAVCKGTTNAYVAETLLGRAIARGSYVLGRTTPAKSDVSGKFSGQIPEFVFVDGGPVEMSLREAVTRMKPGDVVIKGANALNHAAGLAGLLVGHPEGGTLGAVIGSVYGKGLHLVVPVGLEKEIAEDILDLAEIINQEPEISRQDMPALWPLHGEVVTEIEALETLTGVEAHQIGAGGVCEAEGAVRLAVWGSEQQVAATRRLVDEIQGEPPFGAEESSAQ